jgi:hypothetical protein
VLHLVSWNSCFVGCISHSALLASITIEPSFYFHSLQATSTIHCKPLLLLRAWLQLLTGLAIQVMIGASYAVQHASIETETPKFYFKVTLGAFRTITRKFQSLPLGICRSYGVHHARSSTFSSTRGGGNVSAVALSVILLGVPLTCRKSDRAEEEYRAVISELAAVKCYHDVSKLEFCLICWGLFI